MNLVGQEKMDIDTLRDKVLLQYPNQNVITIYNSNMVPIDSHIDSIPVPPKGNDDPDLSNDGLDFKNFGTINDDFIYDYDLFST